MILKISLFFLGILFISSCNFSGIENDSNQPDLIENNDVNSRENQLVKDSITFDNGIVIKFFEHGRGKAIEKNDIVMIDYSCRLDNGKVFDSNKKIGKPIPFIVGWLMQTKGWDFAFQHLKIGDHVEIYLPASMARGATGISGIVPPNSDNWIDVNLVSLKQPDMNIDGVKVFLFEREKDAKKVQIGDELDLDYIAYSESKPRYSSSFENGAPFKFKVGSGSNLPGLNMAIENAYYNDMMWVLIPSNYAFGAKGSVNNVKPNESVLFDILISERVDL